MSYKRRQQQIHQAQEHEFYETPSGNPEADSTEMDLALNYQASFPGPRETRLRSLYDDPIGVASNPNVHPDIDWAVGGVPGLMKVEGSTGVTNSETVDAHQFTGMAATVRRMPDTNYGPVSTADHNSLLSMLYAMQESSHYYPNDISQIDVIKAV